MPGKRLIFALFDVHAAFQTRNPHNKLKLQVGSKFLKCGVFSFYNNSCNYKIRISFNLGSASNIQHEMLMLRWD